MKKEIEEPIEAIDEQLKGRIEKKISDKERNLPYSGHCISEQARNILKTVFGYNTFWPLQEKIVLHIMEKKDALFVMPTGGGKSLCFQIPALLFEGLTIVVSPLISLMKDQVDQLKECGVPALFLNSSLSIDQFRRHVEQLKANGVKLLYLAPEALLNPRNMAFLSPLRVDCIAIDEAHCISEWGHDFRPEYRQLVAVRSYFPHAVCVALTATATVRVREDIKRSLQIDPVNEFIGSFNRPNLFLEVAPKTDPIQQTINIIKKYSNESGIIYCFSRQQTNDLCEILHTKGYSVKPYHAGLSEQERTENQELFIRDDIQIIVATIAFGMGINKSNVRFVVHYDLPRSIDNYYQEIGRAGRDGLPAHCLLLFGYRDIRKIKYFINQKTEQEQRVANILLNTFIGLAETDLCRRIPLLNYFGENDTPKNCGMCDNCQVEAADLVDLTMPAQMFLSCVKLAGEFFGAGHIIDVLRGSSSQKVLKFGHDQLSTYGIGTAHSTKQWRNMSRQFIQKGLLIYDYDHGTLKLTQKAWEVLKGKEAVRGRLEEGRKEKGEVLGQREGEAGPHDPVLFEILRKKRKEIANLANLPPFTIFHDRTLKEMAVYFPQTREGLSTIYGIGMAKLEKYADTFLRIIGEYCQAHQITERPKTVMKTSPPIDEPSPSPSSTSAPASTSGSHTPPVSGHRRHHLIGQRFNQGMTIERLAVEYNIKQMTIIDYLYQYVQEGYPLDRDEFTALSQLTTEQRQAAMTSFNQLGTERLRPIFDDLNGEISYEELKLFRLSCLCGQQVQTVAHKTFVCLAASRKYGGYCIAGREWSDGKIGPWIRPVSSKEAGELTTNDIRMNNGNIPQCLDIITIPIKGPAPHPYQKENILIGEDRPWTWQWKLPYAGVSKFVEAVERLWGNGHHSINGFNDRIPEEIAQQGNDPSLYLIKPDGFTVIVSDDIDGRKKVRARFEYQNIPYILVVTDPGIEMTYLMKDNGEYPLIASDLYLTVSLSEPFHGYCYKLAAAVITNQMMEADDRLPSIKKRQ